MILVDTSVWIDFLGNREVQHVAALHGRIENEEDLCLCGIILAEVLQGIRSDAEHRKTREYLDDLIFLPMGKATFQRAAEVYRLLRRKGVIIRKPVDCMIAAVAIEQNVCLLHNDRDFDRIAEHTKLGIVSLD